MHDTNETATETDCTDTQTDQNPHPDAGGQTELSQFITNTLAERVETVSTAGRDAVDKRGLEL